LNSSQSSKLYSGLNKEKLPSHVAIIMDGNGRWAKKRLMNRINGHKKGADTVRAIIETSREIGISNLTLYAFSTENWQRPRAEVEALMSLLIKFLKSEQKNMMENSIRLSMIGQIERLPEKVRTLIQNIMDLTKDNDGLRLNLALSYGSRAEIVRMVRILAEKVKKDLIEPHSITEDMVADSLYTRDIPDPDLLIRTSGEMRISNFLLWQIAYSEIYVTDTLWPDFGKDEYIDILKEYQKRDRRFGKVKI